MRIIIISPHPDFGGSSTANQNIAKAIARAGHDVVYMDEYLKIKQDKTPNLSFDDYPIHKNKTLKQFASYKYILSLKPNMVIFGIPIIGVFMWPAVLLLMLKGVKVGCIFHSLSLSNNFKGKIIDSVISCFASTCTHLFFVSNYTLKSWRQFLPLRCKKKSSFVVFNPIVKSALNEKSAENALFTIGFVGRFSEEKQPALFCDIAKSFKDNCNVKFMAFGNGPLLEDCKKQYSEYVEFKGYCNDIVQIYGDMNLLIMTSKFENCPMAILESASFGIPTVAPNVGGIPEIVTSGMNGELYDLFNVPAIKEKIETIITNYSRYSHNAIENVKSFTIDTIAVEWNKILKNK